MGWNSFMVGFIIGSFSFLIVTIGADFILVMRKKSKVKKHIRAYHDILKKGFENRDREYYA
jgi:hypothetical protein